MSERCTAFDAFPEMQPCPEPHWAAGFCHVHGRRFYKTGDAGTEGRKKRKRFKMPRDPADGMLWCGICETELPLANFDKSQDDGYRKVGRCRRCSSYAAQASNHGTTVERLLQMEHDQNGCCAICGKPETKPWRLSLDHDHAHCPGKKSCGECIRGLVCDAHNRMLGLADDEIEVLESAINYLKAYEDRKTY